MRPMGTEMIVARPVMMSVPQIAWTAPPPSATTLRIDHVKKVMSKRSRPLMTTVQRTEASGRQASTNAVEMSAVINRSIAWRRLSAIAESTPMNTMYITMPTNNAPTMLKSARSASRFMTANTAKAIAMAPARMAQGAQVGSCPEVMRRDSSSGVSVACSSGRVVVGVVMSVRSRELSAAVHEPACDRVDDEGHDEQDEAGGNERVDARAVSLGEVLSDVRGDRQRIARLQQLHGDDGGP